LSFKLRQINGLVVNQERRFAAERVLRKDEYSRRLTKSAAISHLNGKFKKILFLSTITT
jgi:hypothetical protein